MRTPLLLVLAAGALVLDPASACIGSPSYTFGEHELRAAVEGTWQLTITSPKGSAETYTLAITESDKPQHAARAWIKSAAACGSRSFVRNASACMDTTRMPLDVRIVAGPATDGSGELMVVGTKFEGAELRLGLGSRSINASITPKGVVETSSIYDQRLADPAEAGTAKLERTAAKS